MNKIEMLANIELGKATAETDFNLIDHYVTLSQTTSMIKGKNSIVLGAKGTGKSSILKYIVSEKDKYETLINKKILKAMNHEGELVFKELLAKAKDLNEDDLILSWKIYFISLVWKEFSDDLSSIKVLSKYLMKHNIVLNGKDFKQMIGKAVAFTKLFQYSCTDGNGFEHSIGLKPEEVIEYIQKVESMKEEAFDADLVYSMINEYLEENESEIWIMIDRVDEAIVNNPELETKALRALLRTFNALQSVNRIKLKLMLRDDIFNNVTNNGFAALSHIAAHCTTPIMWTPEQLLVFIVRRMFSNKEVREFYNITSPTEDIDAEEARKLFYLMFDSKVDKGQKKPDTFSWIYKHLSDGAGNATPRDFINFFDALFSQMESSERSHPSEGTRLTYKPSLFKKAWFLASEMKLNTQIYAEYYEFKDKIEKFRGGKARHNDTTLRTLFGEESDSIKSSLVKMGVLNKGTIYYEIPYLYRAGLGVKNGNAY